MLAEVQHRYVGDVGDFLTYGLLRVLCKAGIGRLGVIWYLVADETHNADGRHVTYLAPGNRIGQQLRECDPSLFDAMRAIVDSGHRSVASVERARVLPASTRFYSVPLRRATRGDGGGRASARPYRQTWLRRAVHATRDCDAVFLDPDNGIAFGARPAAEKYAYVDELTPFVAGGQSLIVYHHADRSATVEQQATRLLQRVSDAVAVDPLGAVVARRGTVRLFILVPQPSHRDSFAAALRRMEGAPWGTHLQPVYCWP
jgi:hypothetical protein